MKIPLLLSCFLSFVCFGIAKPRKDVPYIYLTSSDTLQIQVIDNLTMSDIGASDRFRRIKETLDEVFEEIDFPMAYKVTRFGARQDSPNQPRLDIHIMKWGDNGMSEIEVRFSASIRRDYDRNKLGVFYNRGGFSFGTSDQMIRVYNDVLREALVDMASELNDRLTAGITMSKGDKGSGSGNDVPENQ